jgi:hypothetical protein
MGYASQELPRCGALLLLVFLFVLFLVVFVFGKIAVAADFFFFLVVIFVVVIVGNQIKADWMYLQNFEFGFTLRATENFAFLDFVFVNVDFGGTFRTTDHGSTPLWKVTRLAPLAARAPPSERIIYRRVSSQPGVAPYAA